MKTFFMGAFVVAAAVEVVVVVALVIQLARQKPGTAPVRPVARGTEMLGAGALFGGAMTLTGVLTHGWRSLDSTNLLVFASTFGIVTAALAERLRGRAVAPAAYALPLGFGIVAGLAGSIP